MDDVWVLGADLRKDMTATLIFMPELMSLGVKVIDEVINRAVRVAILHGAKAPEIDGERP